jgi:hypothetical protein
MMAVLRLLIFFLFFLCSASSFAAQDALRASTEANPPQNMRRAIIFNGVWVLAITVPIFFLRGRQARRELDEQMNEQQKMPIIRMSETSRPSSQEESSTKA